MLIQCQYCGAPLDVRPHQTLVKCSYCDTSSRVNQAHTVATQTPKGWQPPRQWVPPAHFPADSAKVLIYHATHTIRKVVTLVITLAVLGVVLPFGGWVASHFLASGDAQGALQTAEEAIDKAKKQAREIQQASAAPKEDLFATGAAAALVQKLRAELGGKPVRALRLVLYPEYAMLEAQDPVQPTHVNRYSYRAGALGEPSPVNVQTVRGKLNDHLVTLDEVRLDRLPELIAATLRDLAYEEGKVSHVIVEKNLPFTKHVVMRIYVSGPRESGRIDYTGSGQLLRAYK